MQQLLDEGHDVVVLSRQPAHDVRLQLSTRVKPVTSLAAINPATCFDAVINLAGEGILDKRWSPARKKVLLDSRIGVTAELVDLIERMENKPDCLISASAVGFYGVAHGTGEVLDESAAVGNDFAATLCNRWEQAARRVESMGVRTCIVRIGVVLHPDGGALQKMLPAFRLGLGGPIGDGQQIVPWIIWTTCLVSCVTWSIIRKPPGCITQWHRGCSTTKPLPGRLVAPYDDRLLYPCPGMRLSCCSVKRPSCSPKVRQ